MAAEAVRPAPPRRLELELEPEPDTLTGRLGRLERRVERLLEQLIEQGLVDDDDDQ